MFCEHADYIEMSECEVKFELCCTPCGVHAAKVRGTLSPTPPGGAAHGNRPPNKLKLRPNWQFTVPLGLGLGYNL